MAITLDLASKDDDEIGPHAQAIFEAMDGKSKYAAVQTQVTALGTAATGYETARVGQQTAEAAAKAATQTKKDKRGILEGAIEAVANGLTSIKPGLPDADLLEAKFTLRAAANAIGPLAAPIDFLATAGDEPGEIDLTWSAIKGRRFYDVEYRLNVDGAAWSRLDPSPTKSKATVEGLESGKEYVFRVRAVGTAGPSPWSDVSIKRVP